MENRRLMREVFVHQDHARVGFYKSILDQADIPNFVRNELSNNSLSELPSPIFFPALCVVNGEDYDRAMQILREISETPPAQTPEWRCQSCSEEVPGTFDSCWSCGKVRVEGDDIRKAGID